MLLSKVTNVNRVRAISKNQKVQESFESKFEAIEQPQIAENDHSDAVSQIDQCLFLLSDINFKTSEDKNIKIIKDVLQTLKAFRIQLIDGQVDMISMDDALIKLGKIKDDIKASPEIEKLLYRLKTIISVEIAKKLCSLK